MTMITPSYLGETIEYSSLHACRSTLEDPNRPLAGRLGLASLGCEPLTGRVVRWKRATNKAVSRISPAAHAAVRFRVNPNFEFRAIIY